MNFREFIVCLSYLWKKCLNLWLYWRIFCLDDDIWSKNSCEWIENQILTTIELWSSWNFKIWMMKFENKKQMDDNSHLNNWMCEWIFPLINVCETYTVSNGKNERCRLVGCIGSSAFSSHDIWDIPVCIVKFTFSWTVTAEIGWETTNNRSLLT